MKVDAYKKVYSHHYDKMAAARITILVIAPLSAHEIPEMRFDLRPLACGDAVHDRIADGTVAPHGVAS